MKLRRGRAAASILLLGLAACATHGIAPLVSAQAKTDTGYEASVARTGNGVPHVAARDWGSLGYGYGYTIADDNLCVLAAAFVTLRGERSRYFGAGGKAPHLAALQAASNLDSDFLFRLVADAEGLAEFRAKQDAKFTRLVAGYADGYSRYVAEIKAGGHSGRHADCRTAEWLDAIGSDDIFRRLYTANLALSETQMIRAAANAPAPSEYDPAALAAAFDPPVPAGNDDASGSEYGLLFGNPHWLWAGMDRFYQVHLRIPGESDVQGASIMGVPVVLIGFNGERGWNHAVSTANRFAFLGLNLSRNDPTAYIYDGRDRKRQATRMQESVAPANSSQASFESTRHGSHSGTAFGHYAATLRAVNADDPRSLRDWMQRERIKSMDELRNREAAIPRVDSIATPGNDPRACHAHAGFIPLGFGGKYRACGEAGTVQDGAHADVAAPDLVASIDSGFRLANASAPPAGIQQIDQEAGVPSQGNSYLQLVKFGDRGPQAWTRMAPSQSTDPASPYSRNGIRSPAGEEWSRAPHTQSEIDADTVETVQLSGAGG